MVKLFLAVSLVFGFGVLTCKLTFASETRTTKDFSVGILHPGYPVCNLDNCQKTWWLLNESMDLRDILVDQPIPESFEGYLIWVEGTRIGNSFIVENYEVLSSKRFGDLLNQVANRFRASFSCLMDRDRFRGKLREFWSGEHNEVTLIFRFYSVGETPKAFVELRFNGRNGKFLGQTVKPTANPCQVQFWPLILWL